MSDRSSATVGGCSYDGDTLTKDGGARSRTNTADSTSSRHRRSRSNRTGNGSSHSGDYRSNTAENGSRRSRSSTADNRSPGHMRSQSNTGSNRSEGHRRSRSNTANDSGEYRSNTVDNGSQGHRRSRSYTANDSGECRSNAVEDGSQGHRRSRSNTARSPSIERYRLWSNTAKIRSQGHGRSRSNTSNNMSSSLGMSSGHRRSRSSTASNRSPGLRLQPSTSPIWPLDSTHYPSPDRARSASNTARVRTPEGRDSAANIRSSDGGQQRSPARYRAGTSDVRPAQSDAAAGESQNGGRYRSTDSQLFRSNAATVQSPIGRQKRSADHQQFRSNAATVQSPNSRQKRSADHQQFRSNAATVQSPNSRQKRSADHQQFRSNAATVQSPNSRRYPSDTVAVPGCRRSHPNKDALRSPPDSGHCRLARSPRSSTSAAGVDPASSRRSEVVHQTGPATPRRSPPLARGEASPLTPTSGIARLALNASHPSTPLTPLQMFTRLKLTAAAACVDDPCHQEAPQEVKCRCQLMYLPAESETSAPRRRLEKTKGGKIHDTIPRGGLQSPRQADDPKRKFTSKTERTVSKTHVIDCPDLPFVTVVKEEPSSSSDSEPSFEIVGVTETLAAHEDNRTEPKPRRPMAREPRFRSEKPDRRFWHSESPQRRSEIPGGARSQLVIHEKLSRQLVINGSRSSSSSGVARLERVNSGDDRAGIGDDTRAATADRVRDRTEHVAPATDVRAWWRGREAQPDGRKRRAKHGNMWINGGCTMDDALQLALGRWHFGESAKRDSGREWGGDTDRDAAAGMRGSQRKRQAGHELSGWNTRKRRLDASSEED